MSAPCFPLTVWGGVFVCAYMCVCTPVFTCMCWCLHAHTHGHEPTHVCARAHPTSYIGWPGAGAYIRSPPRRAKAEVGRGQHGRWASRGSVARLPGTPGGHKTPGEESGVPSTAACLCQWIVALPQDPAHGQSRAACLGTRVWPNPASPKRQVVRGPSVLSPGKRAPLTPDPHLSAHVCAGTHVL